MILQRFGHFDRLSDRGSVTEALRPVGLVAGNFGDRGSVADNFSDRQAQWPEYSFPVFYCAFRRTSLNKNMSVKCNLLKHNKFSISALPFVSAGIRKWFTCNHLHFTDLSQFCLSFATIVIYRMLNIFAYTYVLLNIINNEI